MTGDEFLKLAVDLFTKNRAPSEALSRTIVSRAYYAAYHLARAYTVELGFPETDKHRFLSDALSASGESNVTRAGDLLRYLATARGRADYDLTKPNVIKQVQNGEYVKAIIESADTVKELLANANSDQAKAQAKAGIAAFWK
jgi:uncharacterized protein (UPF0332 family)